MTGTRLIVIVLVSICWMAFMAGILLEIVAPLKYPGLKLMGGGTVGAVLFLGWLHFTDGDLRR